MATLRSLLTGAGGGGTISNIGHTSLVHRQKPGKELLFLGMCGNAQDQNYCRNIMCNWKVPPDTSCITFEIWGGGGGGAGSCCCAWGIPGGSGAWAKKTITGDLGGCDYVMYAGFQACCSPVMACGYRGCQSYVTGFGLSNFCAEGGYGGCTWCNMFSCFQAPTPAGFGQGCGFCFPIAGCCACYFGADCGVAGCSGGLFTSNCNINSCYYKDIMPVAAGMLSSDRAFVAVRKEGRNSVPNAHSYKAQNGLMGGASLKTPGMGGSSSASEGGNCYCGVSGGGGFIKVSYN